MGGRGLGVGVAQEGLSMAKGWVGVAWLIGGVA